MWLHRASLAPFRSFPYKYSLGVITPTSNEVFIFLLYLGPGWLRLKGEFVLFGGGEV